MALATVTLDVAQSLNVLADLPPQRAFDDVPAVEDGGDGRQLLVGQGVGALVGFDLRLFQDFLGDVRADAVHVLKGVEDLFLFGNVDAGDSGHGWSRAVKPGHRDASALQVQFSLASS